LFSQKVSIGLGVEKGYNRILIGAQMDDTHFGGSFNIKSSLIIKQKNTRLFFLPCLALTRDVFAYKLGKDFRLSISQTSMRISPLAGIPVSEKSSFVIGFFVQALLRSNIEARYNDHNGLFLYYSTSDYMETYDPKKVQAGFQLGYNISIGKSNAFQLEFILQQFATSFLNSLYTFNKLGAIDQQVQTFDARAKASVILIGLTCNISALAKKKSNTEDL
jgi:hypothetical protein